MTRRIRIGVLTPSSNTALEPLTSAMVSSLPGVSAHFSRFTVTEISLRDQSLNQFDDSKILEARTLGLVSPYVEDVQQKIIANYRGIGIDCVAEQHLGITVNFKFGEVEPDTLRAMLREAAKAQPDAMTVMCTNLHAAQLVEELEAEEAGD